MSSPDQNNNVPRLILASKSKSRQQLLKNAGFSFTTCPVDLDERALEQKLTTSLNGKFDPEKIALHLASAKALLASEQNPDALVIGADQILSFDGKILHKPDDRAQAKQQLLAFRTKTHTLHAAIALARNGQLCDIALDQAHMTMRNFSETQCDSVLELMNEQYLYCVGAYTLEGPAVRLFEKIEGDYFTILGLPMLPLLAALRKNGIM